VTGRPRLTGDVFTTRENQRRQVCRASCHRKDDRRAIGGEALLHIGAGATDPDDFIADDGNRVPREGRKWMRTRTNLERAEARRTLSFG